MYKMLNIVNNSTFAGDIELCSDFIDVFVRSNDPGVSDKALDIPGDSR